MPHEWAHILIQDNCAWWNYISHWHTGMAHPAKRRPTGDPTESRWLLTFSCQSVGGNAWYNTVQEPYLRCLSVSKASAGKQLRQIIRLPLGSDNTHTLSDPHVARRRIISIRQQIDAFPDFMSSSCAECSHAVTGLGAVWAEIKYPSCADRSCKGWHYVS